MQKWGNDNDSNAQICSAIFALTTHGMVCTCIITYLCNLATNVSESFQWEDFRPIVEQLVHSVTFAITVNKRRWNEFKLLISVSICTVCVWMYFITLWLLLDWVWSDTPPWRALGSRVLSSWVLQPGEIFELKSKIMTFQLSLPFPPSLSLPSFLYTNHTSSRNLLICFCVAFGNKNLLTATSPCQ